MEENKKLNYVHKDSGSLRQSFSEASEAKQEDIHLTKGFTGWVHHHRTLAKWLMKFLVAGIASLLYYLRREEKHIEEESKKVKVK